MRTQGSPLWNYYRCKDDRWIVLANMHPDRDLPIVCRALGIEHLIKDPKFTNQDDKSKNNEELINIMDEIFLTRTVNEWMKVLKSTGDIVCTPLQKISDLPNDPQVIANDYIVELEHEVLGHIKMIGVPIELSKTPADIKPEAPELGQQTEEVLIEMGGYTWEEIAELREKEVI